MLTVEAEEGDNAIIGCSKHRSQYSLRLTLCLHEEYWFLISELGALARRFKVYESAEEDKDISDS